jgi:hypothetical protein
MERWLLFRFRRIEWRHLEVEGNHPQNANMLSKLFSVQISRAMRAQVCLSRQPTEWREDRARTISPKKINSNSLYLEPKRVKKCIIWCAANSGNGRARVTRASACSPCWNPLIMAMAVKCALAKPRASGGTSGQHSALQQLWGAWPENQPVQQAAEGGHRQQPHRRALHA